MVEKRGSKGKAKTKWEFGGRRKGKRKGRRGWGTEGDKREEGR